MNTFKTSVLALSLSSIQASAYAAVLATGGVYGGPDQHKAYCYLFNQTPIAVIQILSAEIIKQDGTILQIPPSDNSCHPVDAPNPLSPLHSCVLAVPVEDNATYGCRIVIEGKAAAVRGTLDIRNENESVLTSSPLR